MLFTVKLVNIYQSLKFTNYLQTFEKLVDIMGGVKM